MRAKFIVIAATSVLTGCGSEPVEKKPLTLFGEAEKAVKARLAQADNTHFVETAANVIPDQGLVCGVATIDTLPAFDPGILYAYQRGVGAFVDGDGESFCKLLALCEEAMTKRRGEKFVGTDFPIDPGC